MARAVRSFTLAALSALLLLLPGCNMLFPEKLDALIHINSDWTYSIEFTGIITDYMARTSRVDHGKLTADDEASLAILGNALRNDRRFRKVHYLGDERYEVEFYETGILQGEVQLISGDYFAKILSITPRIENHVTVEGVRIDDDKERAEARSTLEKLGMGIDWRIRVKTDAEVVTSNAQQSPWFFGLLGSYEWAIDSLDDPAPLMVLKME